ncbi:hypothetical protein BDS110ZK4_62640 [Bradyrhizobium diazoefficiens]|uniref:Uncharacterized protein n=1 Tax=Bradyrhizobium diazoefficiens TaxID=1355477 RepID=A0A809X466_9BRAD|nr:hypothetical protein XF1B_42340 [Bradyrhizobium diazoefficiens]BCF26263.1 hypothetical protein XF14B_42150 [Bradyrhizobium diazoefficiens]BCF69649.1 hypothetical protein XF19B_40020 [Bradyrhizobium diazoefficiens]
MAGSAPDIALTSFAGSAMIAPTVNKMHRLRKMADGIFRIYAGTQLRLCYSLMMAPPYSAASPVAAAASASLI